MGQLPRQPDSRELPIAPHGARRDIQHVRDFLFRQPAEVAQLHHLGLTLGNLRERRQRFIQRDHRPVRLRHQNRRLLEVHADRLAAAFARTPGARGVHQNAAHHLRRHRKELGSLAPFHVAHIHQSKIDLMDQRGGLKNVPLALVLHEAARHPMQFAVDPFRQPVQRFLIAVAPGSQQVRDLGAVVHGVTPPRAGHEKLSPSWPVPPPVSACTGERRRVQACTARCVSTGHAEKEIRHEMEHENSTDAVSGGARHGHRGTGGLPHTSVAASRRPALPHPTTL